jgi:hypothetical protein
MNDRRENSTEELDEHRRKMLRVKRMISRWVWVLGQISYVLFLIAALIAILQFLDGVWRAICLTIFALAAGVLPELFIECHYSKYRKELGTR